MLANRGEIGRRVRVARHLANLRVVALAQALQRVPMTVYRWEQGRRDPPLSDLRRIAKLTGCDLAWLVTGNGAARPQVRAARARVA